LRVRVIRRPRYACRSCEGAVVVAPAPERPIDGGMATEALVVHIVVSKFCDALPLYRQSKMLERQGIELDRSTLSNWLRAGAEGSRRNASAGEKGRRDLRAALGQAAWLLDPVVAAIRRHVFAAEKIHGDDTTVPVLAPGLGRTATGRLWVYVRDDRLFAGPAAPAAAYFYSPDRGAQHPTAHMASFTGFLQADGYAGVEGLYNPARTKPGPITEVACWSHCRRKFYDGWESTQSPIAKEAQDRIAAVYAIEDKARFAPAAERVEHRRALAPLLDAFFTWAEAVVGRLSGKLELAKAFRYTITRREALTRFVTDGRLEADNNLAENAMRVIALGRRNYLFAGSDRGGERAASIYTLVATAKLNGLNPETYLRDILAKIAEGHTINRIDELLPWRMIPTVAASP
jgi:transposase